MIVAHKYALQQRCNQRGYTLEEVMACVVKQEGDMWTIDETHPSYPKEAKKGFQAQIPNGPPTPPNAIDLGEGVGTELKKLLKVIGITSSPTCGCNAKAKKMNENGIEWCKDNIDTIVSWLKEEADKRNIPFFAFGAKRLIKFAIGKAEKVNNVKVIQ